MSSSGQYLLQVKFDAIVIILPRYNPLGAAGGADGVLRLDQQQLGARSGPQAPSAHRPGGQTALRETQGRSYTLVRKLLSILNVKVNNKTLFR